MSILKKSYRFLLAVLLVAAIAFSVTACKKDTTKDKDKDPGETVIPGGDDTPGGDTPTTPGDEKPDPSVKYTVSFANVDEAAYPAIQVSKNGTVSVNPPQRTGATFLGWFLDDGFTTPFTMGATKITGNSTIYAKWKTNSAVNPGGDTPVVPTRYTVTFNSDGGSAIDPQTVEEGKTAFKPTDPQKAGYQFLGWYKGETKFDVTKNVITSDTNLVAKWQKLDAKIVAQGAYNESLYVEWKEGAPASASVEYSPAGESNWTQIDSELIRAKDTSTARADILGVKAGSYDIKITPSAGTSITVTNISVNAYDRSGYAHFKYTDGVGAYKDDGTLKNDAIVIYVTEQNKNTVMKDACAKYDCLNMFKIPTYSGTPGKDWGNKDAEGIGWWLNNAQYSMDNAASDKNKRPSNTYDATNGKNLAFKPANATHPIVIRFIGKVTVPEGCTAYDSEDEGGLKGDGGFMARMKNMKNVTIEGVGDDAEIYGWGFHFLAGSDAVNGQGKSFEVRNLKFDKYVEDAVGMEGVQSGGKITGSVDRCWIHNNTFLPGDGTNGGKQSATESDKAEGDGSIDFKRGEYMTSAYNYFADCHKTGLIGSSDSSLQYNISMHHNWYHNCGSRMPLARQANIHFYNNYVSIDPDAPEASYVHSIRANSYMFCEANYYFGCKDVTDAKGSGKGWNNVYLGCIGNNQLVDVTTREQAVSNSCAHFSGTDLSKFDTNPALFYYDAANKVSDCILDDAATARQKALQYAGRNGWGTENPKKQGNPTAKIRPNINDVTPSSPVPVPESGTLNITMPTSKGDVTVSGVMFTNISGITDGAVKGKQQIVTFMLSAEAQVTFTTTSTGIDAPDLVRSDGTVYVAGGEGTVKVTLPAGIYVICSGQYGHQPKETFISALSFESTANSAKAKLEAVNSAINEIGTVTLASGSAIENAKTLYNALNEKEKTAFAAAYPNQYEKIAAAEAQLATLQVQNVQTLIDAIGAVGENSYPAISAARTAYDALTATQKGQVSNYSTLTSAEADWANVAVISVNNQISALADASTVSSESDIKALLENYNSVKAAYDNLTSEQKNSVTNINKVTSGISRLEAALAPYTVRDMIAALPAKADVTLTDADTVKAAREAYDKLTADQKTVVGDITKLTDAEAAIKAISDQTTVAIFTSGNTALASNAGFTVSGKYNSKGSFEYNGNTYTAPLKMESSTSVTFTTAAAKKITVKIGSAGGQLKIDGTVYEDKDNDGFIVIDSLAAGNHSITKASGDPNLCYVLLEPSTTAA